MSRSRHSFRLAAVGTVAVMVLTGVAAASPAGAAVAAAYDPDRPTLWISSGAGFADRTPLTLTFSEAMSHVSTSTLGVKRSGGTTVAGTITTVSASKYRFTPSAPWLTGGYVRVWVAPAVTDSDNNPAVPSTILTRASTTADSAGAAITYRDGDAPWLTRTSSDAYGGTYRRAWDHASTRVWAAASVTVHGSTVSVGVCKSPTSGSVQVYVDGTIRKTVSLYRSWTGCESANTINVTGLARGDHRVKLVGVSTGGHGHMGIDRVSVG